MTQKAFFKSDKVKLAWNAQGTALLVEALTDVDKSNKSYYGETTLYLLSAAGDFDARVTLDKDGPIHDVAWSPNSKEFGVVYGYMPAKTTVFNHRGAATHSFPIGPRNKIIFSPTGRFGLVAGFGNLAGQMDIYDLEKGFRKVCTIESGNPSVCEWSADSRYIMTATLSPRLRVDNGVKLWHVSGALMYNQDMTELYSAMWRPLPREKLAKGDPLSPVPAPHPSAASYLGTVKTPSKPAGAYRPPGARGLATPLHFKREDEGGAAHVITTPTATSAPNGFGRPRRAVPGADPSSVPGADAAANGDENLSKAAMKNKKRRGNKKPKEEGANGGEGANLAPPKQGGGRSPERRQAGSRSASRDARARQPDGGAPVNGGGDAAAPPSEEKEANPNAKKIRGLQKKIRAIEELEMRVARREKLEDTQMKKIGTKDAVLKELAALGES